MIASGNSFQTPQGILNSPWIFYFNPLVGFNFLLWYLVHHLWTTMAMSLVILSRLCPIYHLWTDGGPDFIIHFSEDFLFAVISCPSSLKGKALSLVTPPQLCPVYHIRTDRYPDFIILIPVRTSFCSYVQFTTSEQQMLWVWWLLDG